MNIWIWNVNSSNNGMLTIYTQCNELSGFNIMKYFFSVVFPTKWWVWVVLRSSFSISVDKTQDSLMWERLFVCSSIRKRNFVRMVKHIFSSPTASVISLIAVSFIHSNMHWIDMSMWNLLKLTENWIYWE